MAFKVSGSGLNKLPEEASSRKSPGKGKSQVRETAVFDQSSAGGTSQRKLLSPTQKKLANVGTSHSSDSTTLRDALRAEDAFEDFEGSSSHHIPQTKTVDPFITKQSARGEQPGIQASKIPTLKQAKRGPSSSHTSHGAEQQTSKHVYEEVLPMLPFTETTHEVHTTKKAPKPPYIPNVSEVREDRHDREAEGSRSGKAIATVEAPASKIPSLKQVKRALPANASSNVVDVSAHNQKLQGSELSMQGLKEVSSTESDLPQAEISTYRCESKLPEITDAGKRQVDIKGIYEAMEAVSVGIKKGSNHAFGTGTDHWETLKVGESSFKQSGPSLHGSSRSDSAEFVVEELSYDSESVYQLTKGDPLCLTESANPSDGRCILEQDKDCLWESSMPATSSQSPISIGDNSFATDSNSLKNSSSANISEVFISNNKSMAATNSGNAKPSQRGETLESRKSSLSRASDSSGISDESTWSNITGSINKPHKANDPRWEAIIVIRKRDGNLGLSHFRLLKRLGCGDIGSVYLAELSGTRCFFAMKVMDKASLASRKKLLRAQTEREILQSLDHPFLPTLYTHFETEKFSCLVMEFCPGGDLHTLRQRQPGKHFSELAARFYAAEVLLALEYLHMLGIVYRDLKPENVLVREDGHIMLSDFDLSLRCAVNPTLVKSSLELDPSKKGQAYCVQPACIEPSCTQPVCVQPSCVQPSCFVPRLFHQKSKKGRKAKVDIANQVTPLPELMAEPTNARSMSFVGTHEYLAPEIIKGEGHGSAVDWWTFGIFLHELIFGKTPFKGSGNRATLFNVVGQPLRFPDSPHASFAARDLIRGLLVKEPQHRLAYKRGATEIKQHPFFEGVNWALIRCTTPPDIPKPFEIELPKSVSAKASASEKKVVADSTSGNYLDFDFF